MKEFETAVASLVAEDQEEDVLYPFVVVEKGEDEDGEVFENRVECYAHNPGDGALIVLMADTMGRGNPGQKLAGIIDFMADALEPESKEYIVNRLLDRHDPFGLDEITPIIWWMVEEFGGRPTKQPSDFAQSRKNGGQKSTRTTSKSTSSGSRSRASSTRSTAG